MNHNLAICFTNFGPYHLARLQALGQTLTNVGGKLIAYEMAGVESKYPWTTSVKDESLSFTHVRLFDDGRPLESLSARECKMAILSRLDQDQPTAIAAVGYVRPESTAMLKWAKANGSLRILMSETQRIDNKRVWWKEAVKSRIVRQFQAGVVGGESHRDYLHELGLHRKYVHLGYNAVGNDRLEKMADVAKATHPPLNQPYFLTVCRFASEKNLKTLLSAYAAYLGSVQDATPWRLVLAGDGPLRNELKADAERLGITGYCDWPGFLAIDELVPWYTHAGAFVLPSLSEPWGLVVNEAAICGLPLLLSDRCGAASTFLPENGLPNGWKFDPTNELQLTDQLRRMTRLNRGLRTVMGETSRRIAGQWGPDRFADGVVKALETAQNQASAKPTKIGR